MALLPAALSYLFMSLRNLVLCAGRSRRHDAGRRLAKRGQRRRNAAVEVGHCQRSHRHEVMPKVKAV